MTAGKVALVTGASSGIGAEVALRLQERGYAVFGAARRVERMAPLAAAGGTALHLDLTDDASIVACADALLERAGRIDVLVNNAGIGAYGTVEEMPLAEARRQFEVNLFGLARLTQLLLPQLRSQRAGHIFNIGSVAGRVHTPLGAWYVASKHALEGFSDALRMELQPFGIHVIVIEPGLIATEIAVGAVESMLARSGGGPYAAFAAGAQRMIERTLRRRSHPRVIADTILAALAARTPRTRYAAGRSAKLGLWSRALLPDRAMDRLLRRMMRP